MKITKIKSLVVNAQMRNWIFVKVETDQDGLWGWGEGSMEWKTRAVIGCVDDLAPFILGQDPTRIEHLYQKMYRQPFFRPGAIGLSAISAIEQACWDIFGKSVGLPVYKLLGGAVRDKVRMYTHLGGGEMKAVYETFDPGPLLERAHQVLERGYSALKVVFVPFSEPLMGLPTVKKFAHLMEQLRKSVGEKIDIMVDFHGRTSPAMAIEYIRAIQEYHPFFCEEPVPPENIDALLQVRQAVSVPIATGERLVTRHQFLVVLEKQACHVIQPDLCHCGGLLEAKKIAALAEPYYVAVAPHNPLGPIANAVALHFGLSTPNFLIQEDMLTDVPWRFEVVQHHLDTQHGYWMPTTVPGLGIEVDETAAAKHPYQPEPLTSEVYAPDGAVLDW